MNPPPFPVRAELDGWRLFWAGLELTGEAGDRLATVRGEVAARVREGLAGAPLSEHPTVAALRRLFRAAGCDPTRYRPASEALVRRLVKGAELPVIHPLVDLNNCLSALLLTPCCVTTEGAVEPPIVLRAGRPGESYESLKGPFDLSGKPVLADANGPYDAPITGSQRAKVTSATRRAELVSYLPDGIVDPDAADRTLAELLRDAPVARVLWTGTS
jgi:DNA/RNA-binding domain of Phe-tRNA-synthetase-like protein